MTNTVLDNAEQRVASANQANRDYQASVVASMRQELRDLYEKAKQALPVIERDIAKTYRPFMARINALAAKSITPLPSSAWSALAAIGANCEGVPTSIRAGLSRYEKLSFQEVAWKQDPVTVDDNRRRDVPDEIRTLLRTYDGALSGMAQAKGTVERIIAETNWPPSVAPPSVMTTGTPPGREENRATS